MSSTLIHTSNIKTQNLHKGKKGNHIHWALQKYVIYLQRKELETHFIDGKQTQKSEITCSRPHLDSMVGLRVNPRLAYSTRSFRKKNNSFYRKIHSKMTLDGSSPSNLSGRVSCANSIWLVSILAIIPWSDCHGQEHWGSHQTHAEEWSIQGPWEPAWKLL